MRLAILVAPGDPRTGDAGARRMALAWLRGRLSRFGYNIVIVGGGQDVAADLNRAINAVSEGDTVLVHVSGRLAGRDAIALSDTVAFPLRTLSDGLFARSPERLSFIAELMHEEDPDDPLVAAECLDAAVRALGARERGHLVLGAVRPLSAQVERVAFTRLTFVPPTAAATSLSEEALLAAMHRRAAAIPESYAVAQSFTFVRGSPSNLPPPMPPEPAEAPPEDEVPAERSLDEQIADATQARQWERALELRRHRLHAIEGARAKIRELVAIARILQAELGDPEAAIEALEVARAIDRSRVSVLQALRRGYELLGRWANAVEIIGTIADLATTSAERVELRVTQAKVAVEHLADADRAIAWLEMALEEAPGHIEARSTLNGLRAARGDLDPTAREELAGRLFAEGDDQRALAELEIVAAREPMRGSVYAKKFTAYSRIGMTDAAFLSAMALEELGEADVDAQVLIGQFRSMTPVRARTTLDDAAWRSLRAPGYDEVLATLFAGVEQAAIAARVDDLKRRRKLPKLDTAERLSESSTASIARSLQWAARVCALECPDLYVVEDGPEGLVALQAARPSTQLGPSVLRGLSAKDLAFLAGRHITYYRPEHHVLVYYPTRDELTNLLLATVQIAMPEQTQASAAPIRALHARISRRLTPEDRATIEAAVERLDARGGRAAIGAWMRSIELTAARVGLLLCGDLATSTAVLRSEPMSSDALPFEGRRADLVAFCASEAHATLRARFTTTAPESVRPPPTASGVHALP
jgi:tetratricopeptide (TPR) repeat protein